MNRIATLNFLSDLARAENVRCGLFPGKLLACLILMLLALTRPGGSAYAGEENVVRATLPNGLRVIIVRNTLAPVVSTSVNYLVGSDEAPRGFPGMAHAQEHMMFRGSPGLSADQLADIGSVMGGNFNADTQESVTQYLFTVPAEDLDVALNIEATRMRGVSDSQEDWDKERGAIEQEVAQDLSNPGYVLFSTLRSALFAGTPYENDALGTRASFDQTTAAMLKSFHDSWYAPNNAILIVVGDIDPAATLAEVTKLFGTIPSRSLPPRLVVDLKPVKVAPIKLATDRPTGTQMIAMRVPGLDSPDFPALEVLADVLSSERGDLYALVPQGKAVHTGFELAPLPKAGLAIASVSFAANADPAALESDVRRILGKIAREGVPPGLVEAAKLQERRQAEFEKNSISGLASVWAEAVAIYGLHAPDDDLVRIDKVTVADVNRVARQYLDLDHAVSAVMMPQGSGKPVISHAGFGGQENIALGEAAPTALPEWADAALKRLTVPHSTVNPVVSTLSNGLTLIVQPEDVSNTVTVLGHIKNRPELETPPSKDGAAQVLDELFSYGGGTLDRLGFQEALDQIGAGERAGTDFAVEVLARDVDRGVELLADNELRPALPADAFETIKSQTAQVVAARNRSPAHLTQRAMREGLYPKTDPSLRESTPESVRGLTLDDVKAYYRSTFRPDLTTIVVIGNITPEQAKGAIEKYFGAWTAAGPKPETDLPPTPPNSAKMVAVPDASRVQDSVALAETLGLTRSQPDYYALELGNAVLGGGFYSTRLSIDLRKNTGLVYSVGSGVAAGKTRSSYTVYFACDPANVANASAIVVKELKNMQATPVSGAELARVKALLIRQIPLGQSSMMSIARSLIARRDLDLPLDEPTIAAGHYLSLGANEVQAAFQKWIRPDDFVQVSQGPGPKG
jgi:zinc protease